MYSVTAGEYVCSYVARTFDDYKLSATLHNYRVCTYLTLLHDDFFPCNNQLTVDLSIVHTLFAIVCFSVLEREMQALRAEKGGGQGKRKVQIFESSY